MRWSVVIAVLAALLAYGPGWPGSESERAEAYNGSRVVLAGASYPRQQSRIENRDARREK